jgi:hypothetical protein
MGHLPAAATQRRAGDMALAITPAGMIAVKEKL